MNTPLLILSMYTSNVFELFLVFVIISIEWTHALTSLQAIPCEITRSQGNTFFSYSRYSPHHFPMWITNLLSYWEISEGFNCSTSCVFEILAILIRLHHNITLWLCFYLSLITNILSNFSCDYYNLYIFCKVHVSDIFHICSFFYF